MNKHPGGRPTKYKPEYCTAIVQFFSVPKHSTFCKKEIIKSNGTTEKEFQLIAADLPTFEAFARSIEVNGDTVVEWAKKFKEFSAAYNVAKALQKEFLVDNGLKGLYPPASFIFVAKNVTDMRDKQEVESTKTFEVTGLATLNDEDLDGLIKGLQNRVGRSSAGEGA